MTPPRSRDWAGACRAGGADACDVVAERWSGRDFVGPLVEEARLAADALKEACDARGVSSACLGYAIMRKSGTATGKADGEGAKPYFAKLKGLGDLNGFRGEAASPEGAASLKATSAACDAGRARACGQLGWAAYTAVQREKSVKDAFTAYARACELGSGNGCRWAGHFAATYPDETGAAATAESFLVRGCDAFGNGGACDEQGAQKAKRGEAGAEGLYGRACDGGVRTGCLHLGEILVGRGDPKGAEVLKLACDAGEEAACKKIAGGK